jgi:hypothetical protein
MIVCIIVEQQKCFDSVDARYKHEDNSVLLQHNLSCIFGLNQAIFRLLQLHTEKNV